MLLSKTISAHGASFKIKAQAHRRIVRTRECRHQTHEFDYGSTGDSRIEGNDSWLRNLGSIDIAIFDLPRAIFFRERFDPHAVGIDVSPAGKTSATGTNHDNAAATCCNPAIRIHAEGAPHVDDWYDPFV